MAKKPNPAKAPRRQPDPAGRVDLLAIRVLERWVETSPNLLLRGIYGTHKKEINRVLRSGLGAFHFHMDGYGQIKLGAGNAR
jgi:hypothetical protein